MLSSISLVIYFFALLYLKEFLQHGRAVSNSWEPKNLKWQNWDIGVTANNSGQMFISLSSQQQELSLLFLTTQQMFYLIRHLCPIKNNSSLAQRWFFPLNKALCSVVPKNQRRWWNLILIFDSIVYKEGVVIEWMSTITQKCLYKRWCLVSTLWSHIFIPITLSEKLHCQKLPFCKTTLIYFES